MFVFRFLSFIALIFIFFLAIFWNGVGGAWIFTMLGFLAGFGAVYEALTMLEKINKPSFKIPTSMVGGLIIFFLCYKVFPGNYFVFIPVFFVLVMWVVLLFSEQNELALRKMINSAAVIMAVSMPLGFLAAIYMSGEGYTSNSRLSFLFLALVTKAGDTGAYVVGMLSNKITRGGNHKIAPTISPKKSWEGFFGGMASSIGVAYLVMWWAYAYNNLLFALLSGIVLFLGGFMGDLTESSFKRACGVKDSGAIIPGMGGVLDVLDSFIYNAPLFYLYLLLQTN